MSYRRLNNRFEASGIGDYENTGNWEWEFYPPPYDFLAPADSVAIPPPVIGGRGMGCAGNCSCNGKCGGLGRIGLGLFDSTDFSTWGIGEYVAIGVGVYLLYHVFSDSQRVSKRVRSYRRRRRVESF